MLGDAGDDAAVDKDIADFEKGLETNLSAELSNSTDPNMKMGAETARLESIENALEAALQECDLKPRTLWRVQ